MILVIDNYDSFTYNLVQYLGILGAEIKVVRNDRLALSDIEQWGTERIVLSPGPGRPEQAGRCNEVIRHFSGRLPILGVCLGHQCIGQVFGHQVLKAPEIVHGKTSPLFHNGAGIFAGIPQGIQVARYHSLMIAEDLTQTQAGAVSGSKHSPLQVTARTQEGIIMAVHHVHHATMGVQFHPESVASEYGLEILKNFLGLSS